MIKVQAITAKWCKKCAQAKLKLADYDIEWLDMDEDYEAGIHIRFFDITHLPSFILHYNAGVSVTTSVLEVKKKFEEIQGQENTT